MLQSYKQSKQGRNTGQVAVTHSEGHGAGEQGEVLCITAKFHMITCQGDRALNA